MATCDLCSNDMTTGASCVIDQLHLAGRPFALPPYRRRRGALDDDRCGDCGVAPGGLHHLGCDLQRCPACRGQLFSCGCPWDEFPDPDRSSADDDWLDDDPFDDEPFDDDAFDDDATVLPFSSPGPVGPPRGLTPLAAAVAPCRARHHQALIELVEWSLAAGRPVDPDIAAMLLELLFGERGTIHRGPLRRPDVTHLMQIDVPNWCSTADTAWPRHVDEHLWTMLDWLHGTDRLPADSDPFDALREPLRCYGGLDADGRRRPPGTPGGIPCQCWLPYDPSTPEGMIQRVIARREERSFLALVHPPDPASPDTFEHHAPFLRLRRKMRANDLADAAEPTDWSFAGRTDPSGKTPALWLYRYEPSARLGYDLLGIDEHGSVYRFKPDRSRKGGYRWQLSPDGAILGLSAA